MLFKELNKFIEKIMNFINCYGDIDKNMSPKERKALIKYLRKAGIEIEE